MTQYTITYRGENPPGDDATRKIVYDIATDDQHFVVQAFASGSAAESVRRRDADVEALLRRAALEEIEARLSAGLPPESWTSASSLTTLAYDSPDVPSLMALLGGRKACLWLRAADPRGHTCLAATAASASVTTPIGCERCQIPDSRLICGSLVFPEVLAGKGVGEESYRQVFNVRCEAASDIGVGALCQPGGKECWQRTVVTGRPAPQPDPDSPRRVVDEIGYLRLVYADRFELGRGKTKEFWPKSDESAVNSLRNPCSGLPDFRAHVVALCQMLLAMKPHGQLSTDRQKSADGHTVNGVTALRRVLDDRFAGAGRNGMAMLEALNEARNRFSHDDHKELVAAMRTLGVSYPPTSSYEVAWWQVAASIADGLGQIRTAVQDATPTQLTGQ